VHRVGYYSYIFFRVGKAKICYPARGINTRLVGHLIDLPSLLHKARSVNVREQMHPCPNILVDVFMYFTQGKNSVINQYWFIIQRDRTLEHRTLIYLLFFSTYRPFRSSNIMHKHQCTFGKVCYGRSLSFTGFILVMPRPKSDHGLILEVSKSLTMEEWSAYKRQTSVLPAGFKPAVWAGEWPHT
jgi:hypothetical protein